MSHHRAPSTAEGAKEPHSVSLKVLRLSKSTLSEQHILPHTNSSELPAFPAEAGLAYPSADPTDQFILTPLLTLPPAFGAAYVGESFSCTLCANNELPPNDSRTIGSVQIAAEMQTPTQALALELGESSGDPDSMSLATEQSIQKIVHYDLKEEGNHVLAVTVTYTEPPKSAGHESETEPQAAASGRVRTFRKLYQFMAQQCLTVRTKAGELPAPSAPAKKAGQMKATQLQRYILEAQLENLGQGSIVLETVKLIPKSPFKASSLNWDVSMPSTETEPLPVLNPSDVRQVAFLIEQQLDDAEGGDALQQDLSRDGRATLGQLSIDWRS
ncbi:MAG: hypothetical protein M4579_006728, partial [Chaenotheca gracillima]